MTWSILRCHCHVQYQFSFIMLILYIFQYDVSFSFPYIITCILSYESHYLPTNIFPCSSQKPWWMQGMSFFGDSPGDFINHGRKLHELRSLQLWFSSLRKCSPNRSLKQSHSFDSKDHQSPRKPSVISSMTTEHLLVRNEFPSFKPPAFPSQPSLITHAGIQY